MLVCGIGGGGTSGAIAPNGGDISAVLMEMDGGAFGLRRDCGNDTFRGAGALLGTAVVPGGKYDVGPATEGRLPGCEEARLRPTMPKLDIVLAGSAADAKRPMLGTDAAIAVESVGDDDAVEEGGAEVLPRRWEMVPITGEVLINCGVFVGVASERVEKVDPPRGLGVVKCEPACGDAGSDACPL
ncbi:hypothetical protein EVJ58_g4939 [Rhodofomes roseus]|uniref:Uncharacterized protein n=1 Tax=Rhodofomes roseus TaxID=34475 RepID=A0A4Y9YEI8_9APHY|nr:hypothetical protein EVJ58_g4939 [Rhodofomes roseus]